MSGEFAARETIETAARESYGRLVSWLAWQWRDIAAAEDALGDALVKALEDWPTTGLPDAPDAWLLTVAKRRLLEAARHDKVRFDPAVQWLLESRASDAQSPEIPDSRLKLLFVCAHPAIDELVRVPLMLQIVLGFQATQIAPALLVSPTALAQRLVRAKQKIRATGLRFEEPDAGELPARLHYVLDALYGAFGMSVTSIDGAESRISDLQDDALFLCGLLCQLLPAAAEAKGLLALMTFCQARRAAQSDDAGRFVPLAAQDVARWDRDAIIAADRLLWEAARARDPGPFQLEAAVHSAHCQRLFTGTTPWPAIVALYREINTHFPTHGSKVAAAVATAETGDLAAALQQLEAMDPSITKSFQSWWVARAYVLSRFNQESRRLEALASYQVALGLTIDTTNRTFIETRIEALNSQEF